MVEVRTFLYACLSRVLLGRRAGVSHGGGRCRGEGERTKVVGVGGSEDVTERRGANEGEQAKGQRQEAGD